MKPVYYSRAKKLYKILLEIAQNGQVYQNMLAEKVNTSYRNLIRMLQSLERERLIRIARKEPSAKKGKEKNVWELTFKGLLFCFWQDLPTEVIDMIAKKNKEKWLIFQEWEKLTSDKETAEIAYFGLHQAVWKLGICGGDPPFFMQPEIGMKNIFNTRFFEEYLYNEATSYALSLNLLFELGFFPELGEDFSVIRNVAADKGYIKFWKVCATTPPLRDFILKELENKKLVLKSLEKFEELFRQLAET